MFETAEIESEDFTLWKTPKDKLNLLVWTVLLYITAPFFEWINLESDLANGKFPVNADSIGLGLVFFIIGWILFAPFAALFTFWVLSKYVPQSALFGFNFKRPLWSFVWTLLFAFLAFDSLAWSFINLYENNLIGAFQHLSLAYFYTVFRA
ncbi:MAG: hypothetical protein LH472_01315, partial [Pyrinomonadaceae bacterium]|nr:hypothetical protein [Pyrinomonadaceae bacterium]